MIHETEEQMLGHEKLEQECTLARHVLDIDNGHIDLGRRRCIDIKGNMSMYMPKGGNPRNEAILANREASWLEVSHDYTKSNCNDDGEQLELCTGT